ncbi:MoaD/ThiS family protein [Candidatus Micrarchaeota archaeon]|nr:MoaD/ThiS family protein [Candidatus Micrarchaeota archaeon]
MKIRFVNDLEKEKEIDLPEGTTIADVVKKSKTTGETIIIRVNKKLAHPKTVLKEGDFLEFIGIIYGG